MIVLGAEGTRKVGIKGWTERRMGVWYPTRGQIGNRSDPHGKHRNDARPFLINRQPLFFLRLALLSPLLQNSPILHPDPFRIEEIARRSLGSHAPTPRVSSALNASTQTISFPFSSPRNVPRTRLFKYFPPCSPDGSVTASILFSLSAAFHNAVKVSDLLRGN